MKNNYQKLAVFIKTCHGRPSLLWVLESVKLTFKDIDYRIYISDEKPLDDWKVDLYDKLMEEGHHVEVHEQGIHCGVARNLLRNQLNDEELILRMDDDFELGGEFNFEAMQAVLNVSDEIGFCSDFERQLGDNKGVKSGSIRPAGGEIIVSPPRITKKFHSPFKKLNEISNIRYAIANHTRNLLLIKREVLEKITWSEKLVFQGEHFEFLMSIKENGFVGAYTPDSIHYHRDDLSRFRHNIFGKNDNRPGRVAFNKLLKERWNCEELVTSYPYSWYFFESVRRLTSKTLT